MLHTTDEEGGIVIVFDLEENGCRENGCEGVAKYRTMMDDQTGWDGTVVEKIRTVKTSPLFPFNTILSSQMQVHD